jgi:flagellar basal body-associated protein FliL
MAGKAEKKPDAAPATPAGDKKDAAPAPGKEAAKKAGGIGGMLGKTPVMLGGVMILEAAVLFAGFKFLGGGAPKHAVGAEVAAGAGHDSHGAEGHGAAGATSSDEKKKTVEIQILAFRAPNKLAGRTFLYDVDIYAVTKGEHQELVKKTIEARKALITDRIRTIIAQTDPEKLGGGSEPGLETLRRQVKYQLDHIVGEGLVDEVLVPRCIPFRTDY